MTPPSVTATITEQPGLCQGNAPTYCQPIGTFTNQSTGEVKLAYCKRWCCPRCGPKKVASFVLRISPEPWAWFLTLTLAGDGRPTRENFQRLAHGWKAVRQLLKRNYTLEEYTWVREQGNLRSRRVHMHVLVKSRRISARRLRSTAVTAGLGLWCHLGAIRSSKQARRYVSKYLSKDVGKWSWPKYTRRCQTTVPRSPSLDAWSFEKRSSWRCLRGSEQEMEVRTRIANNRMEDESWKGWHTTDWLYLTKKEKLTQPP